MFNLLEAYATARPWFPVEAVIIPFSFFFLERDNSLLKAPLILNDPVIWVFSNLK